jgi:hypothetical protein
MFKPRNIRTKAVVSINLITGCKMGPLVKSIWNGPPVWYFAYGSNMKSESMEKRAITPLDAKAVNVPGFYLNFDIFGESLFNLWSCVFRVR